tara:strand:+ start:545 stop:1264 length:720 start_codon:yes stop_codon:yes gene_type:complete
MKVLVIKCLDDNFSYVVLNEANNNACVIDPSESDPIIQIIKKKKINLKYILNTHHHPDHVGGNLELKREFNCNILGFIGDRNNIPGINIFLKDKELFKDEDFEFKTYHTPGHTAGHVIFHFYRQNILFTGDTLFSLGCGRIFEGSYDEMFRSLQLIKNLPKNTLIYFGHEYTRNNSKFCLTNDPDNIELNNKILKINELIGAGKPTTPSTLKEELETNIFLKSKNIKTFKKLRDLKDNF